MPSTSSLVWCRCRTWCSPGGQEITQQTRVQHELDDLDRGYSPIEWDQERDIHQEAEEDVDNHVGFSGTPQPDAHMPSDNTASMNSDDADAGVNCYDLDADMDVNENLETPLPHIDDTLVPPAATTSGSFSLTASVQSDSRPDWIWLFELLLVWLNAVHGVSEQVCALLLTFAEALASSSTSAGVWGRHWLERQRMSVRLRRVRQSLWRESPTVVYALCPDPSCWRPHLFNSATPRLCTRNGCQEELLHPPSTTVPVSSASSSGAEVRAAPQRPRLSLQYESISSWLAELARRRDFFALCDEWRTRGRNQGVYSDIYDGDMWTSDGPIQSKGYLSLSLMIDSFQPFSRSGTTSYSCCVLSLRIDNLPSRIRNRSDYTHVCCILPGPNKPAARSLHAVLEILVVELNRLATTGVQVLDWDGEQRTIRAHLRRLLADTEARTTTAGFPHHSSLDQFCPWCTADGRTWVQQHLQARPTKLRSTGDHRRDCLAALQDGPGGRHEPTEEDIVLLRRAAAAGPCALYKLEGWSSLMMAPVDIMHAIDLGLCRHLWLETLVSGKLLKDGDLQRCQDVLSATTYPLGISKVSAKLGDKGGGSPTAAQWSILSRFLLPVMLARAWADRPEGYTKQFRSKKTTLTGKRATRGGGEAKRSKKRVVGKKGKGRAQTVSSDDEESSASSGRPDDEAGASAQFERTSSKTKTFTRALQIDRIVAAALHLCHASRLVHAHALSESQLIQLHSHLSTFVSIIASDVSHKWVTYNYHVALHIAEQIRLHGPPRSYWSYPAERSYGMMKRIKTNRHRNGEIEVSLLGRSDDKHRIATVVDNLPPTGLATTLKSIIGEDRDPDGSGDEATAGPRTAASSRINLSLVQLEAVSNVLNADRPSDWALFVPFASSTPGRIENILHHEAHRLGHIEVKGSTLSRHRPTHARASDPSACVVKIAGQLRLAFFEGAFQHSSFDVETSKSTTYTYAEIRLPHDLPWPDHHLLRNPMWGELGYLIASADQHEQVIVLQEDIVAAAIVMDIGLSFTAPRPALVGVSV